MKLENSKNKIILILSLIIIFSLTIFAFAVEEESINEQLEQLKNILDSSSKYSAFRKNQVLLPQLKELLEEGIDFEDTKGILENSVKKSIDAYDMKEIFNVLLETKKKGLPTKPIINKINEGLAKNVNSSEIISVISTKAENLKKADEILNEALQEGLEINDEEGIVGILTDSLENDVPQESLSWLLKTGTTEGKSMEEIGEISEELSYLSLLAYDLGLSSEEISLLFKKAIDNSNNTEDMCENIQNSLETEISTAKIEGGGEGKPSATSDSGALPASTTESPVEIGETPTQEAGEAPTETGSPPEPTTSPEEEVPSPPEN